MSNPTHVIWRESTVEFVFPDGYDPVNLSELPEDYDARYYVPDYATQTFVLDLTNAKEVMIKAINTKKQSVESGGALTPLGVVDTDPISLTKLQGAVTMGMLSLQNAQPFEQMWTMQDNSNVLHDATQIIQAGMATAQHISNCHSIALSLKEAVRNATTIAELEAVDIEGASWPSILPPPPPPEEPPVEA